MTPRIQKAIDILLDALNNGTLEKGSCTKCAVGNLVAAGMIDKGADLICPEKNKVRIGDITNGCWTWLFSTSHRLQRFFNLTNKDGLKAISYTDFSLKELAKIEHAFETNTTSFYAWKPKGDIRKDQIKGLEAVVKVMLTFDDQPDDVHEVFTSKAELIPV